MRGWVNTTSNDDRYLNPNLSSAEASANKGRPTATGFGTNGGFTAGGNTHIYVAIRRPHKPAEEFAATDLFHVEGGDGTSKSASEVITSTGFPVDMFIQAYLPGTTGFPIFKDRLRGLKTLTSTTTAAEVSDSSYRHFDSNDGILSGSTFTWTSDHHFFNFRRAPGFFDVVAYDGNSTAGRTVTHNLNAVPELMIVKCRSNATDWAVYDKVSGGTKYMVLNSTAAASVGSNRWNDTDPTDSVFTVGDSSHVNSSGRTYIAYLFASVAGISKVGSYTGTGSDVDVDCGFTSGARFVLVKRTDSTGEWYAWDTERGIVAGNDSYLFLNSNAAQVTSTDYIDPLSSGFTITSTAPAALNASGGNYIFLAIA